VRIRTRTATASIVGTTVFIEATADSLKVFSWEGRVQVETDTGQRYELSSGQQVSVTNGAWVPPQRLSSTEAAARRRKSVLLNGFVTPMETLPVIEKELGLSGLPDPAAAPVAAPQPR
jgi:ferric-dicitrate binding protein FerR (iron transport regulator)